MRRIISFCLICLFCFGLTACGPREHRVLATTAIGAVAGAGLTAAFDGDPLAGAVIGGSIGALGGYAVNSRYYHHRYYSHRPPRHYHGWR
jgi:uncharacterized membrane protein